MKLLLQISLSCAIFWQIISVDFPARNGIFNKLLDNAIITKPNPASITLGHCPNDNTMNWYPAYKNSTTWIWVCDCLETYLYYVEDDSCYEAYSQGPCPPEHYLVLPQGELSSKCEKNPCLEDGLVPFQGSCFPLWEYEPPYCEPDKLSHIIVYRHNFSLLCVDPITTGGGIITAPLKACPEGSRRIASGVCKHVFQ